MPLGNVTTTKGNFFVDEESVKSMKKFFEKRGLDIVVDYEHQSLSDKKALAGGWIKDFYIKENFVVAKVEWTKQAKEEIESKQYRYLSPTLFLKNGRPVRLHSVALTNTPAIDKMTPLTLNDDIMEELGKEDDKMEKLVQLLGLDENASEDDILKAVEELKKANENNTEISANKETAEILGLKEDSSVDEINKTLLDLKNNTVSKDEFLKLKQEMDKKEINEILNKAISDGKIVPAQRESFEKMALSDRAIFEEVLKNQKRTSPLNISYSDNLSEEGRKEFEEIELQACKEFGLTEEEYKKYYKEVGA